VGDSGEPPGETSLAGLQGEGDVADALFRVRFEMCREAATSFRPGSVAAGRQDKQMRGRVIGGGRGGGQDRGRFLDDQTDIGSADACGIDPGDAQLGPLGGPRRIRRLEVRHQRPDRRIFEQRRHRKIQLEPLPNLVMQRNQVERGGTEIEKIGVEIDVGEIQQPGANAGEGCLHIACPLFQSCLGAERGWRDRQRFAVEFATRRQRHPLQHNKPARNHVVWKTRPEMLFQRLDESAGRRVPGSKSLFDTSPPGT
jgi:hypothetical protein